MKKFCLRLLFISLLITASALVLASCERASVVERDCDVDGHLFPEVLEITQQPTCGEEGVGILACSACDYVKTETINATGEHNYGSFATVKDATCAEGGVRERVCNTCGHKDTESTAKLSEHAYGEGTVLTAATCTEAGEKEVTCSVCSNKTTQRIEPLGHTPADKWIYDDEGHWKACTECEYARIDETHTGHEWDENNVCTGCGVTKFTSGLGYELREDGTYAVGVGVLTYHGFLSQKNIVIPSEYKGIPVTAIKDHAGWTSELQSLVIPDSITHIGSYAFASVKIPINLPSSVKTIASEAFATYAYTSVVIPNSVESIGERAFEQCDNLKSLTLGNGIKSIPFLGDHTDFESLEEVRFTGTPDEWVELDFGYCGNTYPNNPVYYAGKLFFGDTEAVEVNISTAKVINSEAFKGCTSLQKIIIGESVEMIHEDAFNKCSSLEHAVIDAKEIGETIFAGCTSLGIIEIRNGVKKINPEALTYIPNDTEILFSATNGWKILYNDGTVNLALTPDYTSDSRWLYLALTNNYKDKTWVRE